MSLFFHLYEKIAPISQNDKIATELTNVLVDAIEGSRSELVRKEDLKNLATKMDIEYLSTKIAQSETNIVKYITWGVGLLATLETVLKFAR